MHDAMKKTWFTLLVCATALAGRGTGGERAT